GSNTVTCKFDRTCNLPHCAYTHPSGREIEDLPMNVICRFLRRCTRPGCFFVHPSGRELDENAQLGVCNRGQECNAPDCSFSHPESRVPVTIRLTSDPQKGGGAQGHVSTPKVRVGGFPPEWSAEGSEALVSRLFEELVAFGSLVAPPELSEDARPPAAGATTSQCGEPD
ncbi:unnamed protein product, partial [Prorocentrum cordatum]